MTFTPQPVTRPRDQVEKQLREAIVSSTLNRGDRLPSEAELSKAFQVSRSTIREALGALIAEGLVSKTSGARGGTFVEMVDHESLQTMLSSSLDTILKLGSVSIDEVTSIRRMLDIPAARLAAANRTQEHAAELEQLIERQDRLLRDNRDRNDPEFFEIGVAIYSIIAAASGNRLLDSFVSAINRATVSVYVRDLRPEVAAIAVERTRDLVAAIIAKDPDAAAAAVAAQLDLPQSRELPSPSDRKTAATPRKTASTSRKPARASDQPRPPVMSENSAP